MVNPLKEQFPRNGSKNTEFLVAEVRKLINIVKIVEKSANEGSARLSLRRALPK